MFKNTLIAFLLLIAAFTVCRHGSAADMEPLPPRNEATFKAILKATEEPSRDVRMRAANALGAMGRADAVPTLTALADDPVPAVRAAALRALCNLLPEGDSVDIALEVPIEDEILRSTALDIAAKLRFNNRETLIKTALDSGTVSERISAVAALEIDSDSDARALLKIALADPTAAVRAEAVRRLDMADDEEALALLLNAVDDVSSGDSFVVRAAACEVLGHMKVDAAIPQLASASQDEYYIVRRAATRALASFAGSLSAAVAVRKRVNDADFTVRAAACDSLGILVDNPSAEALSERLADDRLEVRDAAKEALVKLSPDDAYKHLLRHVADTTETDVRHRAWHVLGEYAHSDTLDLAVDTLRDKDFLVSGYAMRVLRKHKDRRVIPFLSERALRLPTAFSKQRGSKLPEGTIIVPTPHDVQVIEGLLAATQFGMRDDYVFDFARGLLKRALYRTAAGLWPGPVPQAAAARYLGAMSDASDTESIDLIKRLYKRQSRDPIAGKAFREAIKKLTGEELPVPVDTREVYGSYFIEVSK